MAEHPDLRSVERRLLARNVALMLAVLLGMVALVVWTPVFTWVWEALLIGYSWFGGALSTFLP
jgi:hypothetical protein